MLQNPRKWQKQSGNLLLGHPVRKLGTGTVNDPVVFYNTTVNLDDIEISCMDYRHDIALYSADTGPSPLACTILVQNCWQDFHWPPLVIAAFLVNLRTMILMVLIKYLKDLK